MNNAEVLTFPSPDALAAAAVKAWLDEIEAAKQGGRKHTVALSGGRITQVFCAAAVQHARARKTSFDHVHFFWADERCVPPTDPESNFKLANELLFKPLKIGAQNIHRILGEDFPKAAAEAADNELNSVVPKSSEGMPVLDLIFLGMGEDGHVASLFPNLVAEKVDKIVQFLVVENSPKPPPTRISMSYGMIFAAKSIWVLISGAGKSGALQESLLPQGKTPLARVIQAHVVKIFTDIKQF